MTRLLGSLATALLFAMMVLTFVDVWGRYFFNAPVPWAFEVTELMLGTLIFAGLPLLTLRGEHISVDLLNAFMPRFFVRIRPRLFDALCGAAMAAIAFQLFTKAGDIMRYGDVTTILNFPLGYVAWFMCATSAITTMVFFVRAVCGGGEDAADRSGSLQ